MGNKQFFVLSLKWHKWSLTLFIVNFWELLMQISGKQLLFFAVFDDRLNATRNKNCVIKFWVLIHFWERKILLPFFLQWKLNAFLQYLLLFKICFFFFQNVEIMLFNSNSIEFSSYVTSFSNCNASASITNEYALTCKYRHSRKSPCLHRDIMVQHHSRFHWNQENMNSNTTCNEKKSRKLDKKLPWIILWEKYTDTKSLA